MCRTGSTLGILVLSLLLATTGCDNGTRDACADLPNACLQEGALRCAGDTIETCTLDTTECLAWVAQACDAGETCDDSGDTPTCVGENPVCGDDVAVGAEVCDGTDLGSEDCVSQGFTGGTLACLADCSGFDTSACTGGPVCGDDTAEGTEECDGTDLGSEDCVSQGFTGGTLACLADCTGFDTSGCSGGPVCGDDTTEGTEECDGTDLAGEDCLSQGFTGGALACDASCNFDYSACTGGPTCGDDVAAGGEVCDGTDLAGEDCLSQGFTGGNLACLADCTGFDTSACTGGPVCGDGTAEGTEDCDGANLAGEDCVSQGFTGGTLACDAGCSFDYSTCTGGPTCGDGVAAMPEACDGADLMGEDCVSQGFTGGTLTCLADCSGFDTSACTGAPVCGDGVAEFPEECDGTDLAGLDCLALGFDGGTLACAADCTLDTSGCTVNPVCGNDQAEAPEVCDGADLAGQDCMSQGFPSGTLACLADCSGFDTSGCDPVCVCGDALICGAEQCDLTNLNSEDCISQGFTGGSLACAADCTFDTSGCTSGPVCGDDAAEPPEVCDGADLAGEDCISLGFVGGTLACQPDCSGFDITMCSSGPQCGDDLAEAPEVCDGLDLAGEDCISQGFTGGTLACLADCTAFDTSGCFSGPCDPATEFACADTTCIPLADECDDVVDCPDLTDEAPFNGACGPCELADFFCANNACLDPSVECDTVDNCGDGSDEGPANPNCSCWAPGDFCDPAGPPDECCIQPCVDLTPYGLPGQGVCCLVDGFDYISAGAPDDMICCNPDGNGDGLCGGTPPACDPATEFTCGDGTCILNFYECDEWVDCPDLTDEAPFNGNCGPCTPADFFCNNGACLDPGVECDGTNHCGDGSDEGPINPNCTGCLDQGMTCDPFAPPGECCVDPCVDLAPYGLPGQGVCCLYDGTDYLNLGAPDDGLCCNPDSDGDGLCGGTPPVCDPATEFTCNAGSCIPLIWECDGILDCPDSSDEAPINPNCTGCLDQASPCDPFAPPGACCVDPCVDLTPYGMPGQGACCLYDGVDYINAGAPDDGICCNPDGDGNGLCGDQAAGCNPATEFTCGDGTCIPLFYECDDWVDCPDLTDEAPFNGNCGPCTPADFFCNNGACLDPAVECNGTNECFDNSDEAPINPNCGGSCLNPGDACDPFGPGSQCCIPICVDLAPYGLPGSGVCCLEDGYAWASSGAPDDMICCNRDTDGNGLCGPV